MEMTIYKRLGGMKMCIVENDELLRDSMALFFRTKGCSVQAFGSAEEASSALESRPPDILISDHGLPGMDGMKLLVGFGAHHPGTVKILTGAHLNPRLAEEAKRAGIDEVLLKPFSVDEIERALERQLHDRFEGGGTTAWNR
jgi:two-component system nitrogen regulation response regulator GlnG